MTKTKLVRINLLTFRKINQARVVYLNYHPERLDFNVTSSEVIDRALTYYCLHEDIPE